ncbi:MAG: molybdenum cofactor guanylyltransferase [Chloroflexi bacterium]|nr:molybdenum cofactor guanylyltransferase [Chloroflexota bacterium]
MLSIVIQAGGQSQRMGQNKALMPFLGQPLIARVVERVSTLADEVLVITNDPQSYPFLKVPLFADILPRRGNLGGLYTALNVASHPVVGVLACDMPFASPLLLQAQQDILIAEGVDVVIPRSPEGLEPLHSVYRREVCLPAVREALEANLMRMVSWFPAVKVRELIAEEITRYDPSRTAFMNVNTPEEFQRAEALALGGIP